MCRSTNREVGLPVPHRILEGFKDGDLNLLADGLVVSKEVCQQCVSDRGTDLFTEDMEKIVAVKVDYFVDDH